MASSWCLGMKLVNKRMKKRSKNAYQPRGSASAFVGDPKSLQRKEGETARCVLGCPRGNSPLVARCVGGKGGSTGVKTIGIFSRDAGS